MAKKRIIWSNFGYDVNDYEESFKEWCEDNEYDPEEENLEDFIDDDISNWLECERMNLERTPCNKMLAIADLGLWNGRRSGYKIIPADNLSDIFRVSCNGGDAEFYCDGHNVKVTYKHHDGTNYYTIREIKPNHEKALKNLCDKLYNNEAVTPEQIRYCTTSLRPKVAKVYGW